jgi:O-6-methylguanine DNA methyltransferase
MEIITDKNILVLPVGVGYYNSPIGLIKLQGNEYGITELDFVSSKDVEEKPMYHIHGAISQLHEYFQGSRKDFDIPIVLNGTPFQIKVWKTLTTVKYGQTASYKEIAGLINNEKGCRAVGMANNKNPVALIVPCHRIIGSNGSLTGYAGGIDKKLWLLEHEKRNK